jgi:hypothetical protein
MRSTFLRSIISLLVLLLIVAAERTLHVTGVFQQFYRFFDNAYFIILLGIEAVFIFRLLRALKYARAD